MVPGEPQRLTLLLGTREGKAVAAVQEVVAQDRKWVSVRFPESRSDDRNSRHRPRTRGWWGPGRSCGCEQGCAGQDSRKSTESLGIFKYNVSYVLTFLKNDHCLKFRKNRKV